MAIGSTSLYVFMKRYDDDVVLLYCFQAARGFMHCKLSLVVTLLTCFVVDARLETNGIPVYVAQDDVVGTSRGYSSRA